MNALDGRRTRWSFWAKGVAGGGLVVLADQLFFGHRPGSTLGVFALAWLALLVALRPDVRRRGRAVVPAAAAVAAGAALIDHPSVIGAGLFWTALSMTAVLPRSAGRADAETWLRALARQSLLSPAQGFSDAGRLRRLARKGGAPDWRSILRLTALPVGGGLIFLVFFAAANPLIAQALGHVTLPDLGPETLLRLAFWSVVLIAVWGSLRPVRRRLIRSVRKARPRRASALGRLMPTAASVTLALVVFNALFALENGLDAAFLWGGARLPQGMTLAQYAHRGAYPLIATALLAGAFSLLFLREGSPTAERPPIRRLIGLWVAQNVFLVLSSMLRTFDYMEVYSLTRLRLAALIWMGLVAVGLALIGVRLWRRRSGRWLVNANVSALLAVLSVASVTDLGEAAASWNVGHARDAGGRGAPLDLCYLSTLGSSALAPLLTLERPGVSPDLRERAAWLMGRLAARLEARQSDWRGWSWRDARRLQQTRAAGIILAPSGADERTCDGRPWGRSAMASVANSAPRPLPGGERP